MSSRSPLRQHSLFPTVISLTPLLNCSSYSVLISSWVFQ